VLSGFDAPSTLIVGYPGRLARAFSRRWPHASTAGRTDFDITDQRATRAAIARHAVRLIINCAAMTDMARCQREPHAAWLVNVDGVRHLAEAARAVGAVLVHFGSDYAVSPVNEYGWTKRASEGLADLTVRAKIYDHTHWAWQALANGRPVSLLRTAFLNPISTDGVAIATEALLEGGARGLVTVGTFRRLTFVDVGIMWARLLGADRGLISEVDALPDDVPRPRDMFLDPADMRRFGIGVPDLADDSARHLRATLPT
jgi:dTDP-4-dehydrorhamnose reductase